MSSLFRGFSPAKSVKEIWRVIELVVKSGALTIEDFGRVDGSGERVGSGSATFGDRN